MTTSTEERPNAELAYKILDDIDAHPEEWLQEVFVLRSEDFPIRGCFAWLTCKSAGDSPYWETDLDSTSSKVRTAGGGVEYIGVRAEDLLRASRFLDDDDIDPDGEGPYDLFGMRNTREDLGRLVETIFGPRPE